MVSIGHAGCAEGTRRAQTSHPARLQAGQANSSMFSEDKRRAIGEEVAKMLTFGFIMEVFYPECLANPVLVLKKNKTWCMCIDYTCLNKAFPKDPFALPVSIKSLTLRLAASFYLFWMPLLAITRSNLQLKINNIYHPFRVVLLYHHAFWSEKWRRNVSANYATLRSTLARP